MGYDMNSEQLVPELRQLCHATVAYQFDESKAPLLAFKETSPALFDCLQASFGLITSNSRLVEGTHGLMRANPVDKIGTAQADSQMSYLTRKEYEAREMRRRAGSADPSSKRQKATKHDKTKKQTLMIGEQLAEDVSSFVPAAREVLADPSCNIESITEIQIKGRRV